MSQADLEHDSQYAARILDSFGVTGAAHTIVNSLFTLGPWFAPFDLAIRRRGGRTSPTEPWSFDAFRTATFARRFPVPAIIGLTADVVAGLAGVGPLSDLLGRVPVIVAMADACDPLIEAGLSPYQMFSGVKDVAMAWQIVEMAGRANAGILVDCWHHYRGTGDNEALGEVPGDRILAGQLSDALAEPQDDLRDDVTHRLLPGEGDLGVVELIRTLDKNGVDAPVGVEAYDPALLALGPVAAGRRLGAALRGVITESLA